MSYGSLPSLHMFIALRHLTVPQYALTEKSKLPNQLETLDIRLKKEDPSPVLCSYLAEMTRSPHLLLTRITLHFLDIPYDPYRQFHLADFRFDPKVDVVIVRLPRGFPVMDHNIAHAF